MTTRRCLAIAAAVLLAGCGPLPRDSDGTLDRVRREHRFTVGLASVDSTDTTILRGIARATQARPVARYGNQESQLLELEAGRLDLVLGRFSKDTPWSTRVTLGPPLNERTNLGASTYTYLSARNGENAWITLVGRVAKAERGR